MNTYEIDESAERWQNHPVLGRATKFLAAYRDEVNYNSDGWAYWKSATRPAAKLIALIETANRNRFNSLPQPGPTEAELKAAITPIKAFYTRRGNNAGMKFPEGIIEPVQYKITTYRNGRARVHKYNSLDDAGKVAEEIFNKTGVVVGIERV